MALNGGFRLRGIPQTSELVTTGNVYFVSSVSGSDGNTGESIHQPLATLDAATNKCTANKHDIVYIMPNHAETISSATSWVPDIAGVQYIGIGVGSDAPQLTFNATASKVQVTADNQTFKNIKFVAGISAVVAGVEVTTGDYCTFEDCEWYYSGTTTYDFVIALRIDDAHYTTVRNCRFTAEAATAGASCAISLDASNYVILENNYITGDYSAAAIHTPSSDGACAAIMVKGNQIYNDDTASTGGGGIHFPVAHTGTITDNRIGWLSKDAMGDEAMDPGSCLMFQNYVANAIDEYGVELVGAASS